MGARPDRRRRHAAAARRPHVVDRMRLPAFAAVVALLSLTVLGAQSPAPRTFPKHVLAWADVRNGYQHESITHALSTIERLGWESGLYDTIIRTDSQSITKSPILFKQGTGIATGEQFLARNLNYFDAIFFFGVREIDLDAAAARRPAVVRPRRWQGIRGDACRLDRVLLVAGVRRDARRPLRRAPVGHHRSDGGRRRSRPRRSSRHLPASFAVTDEHYQLKDFSRKNVHVLARLDAGQARSQGPAGASHRSRFRRRVHQDLRQGPRVLLDARPSARAVGHASGCRRCTSKP